MTNRLLVGQPRISPMAIGRLAIHFGLAFALAITAAGAIVYTLARAQLAQEVDLSLARDRDRLLQFGMVQTAPLLVRRIAAWEAGRAMAEKGHVVFDRSGRRIFGRLELSLPPPGYADVRFRNGRPKWSAGRALRADLADGTSLVIITHGEMAETMRGLLPTAALTIVTAAGLAGLAATWFFAQLIAGRIARTLAAADAIAAGDLTRRIPTQRLDGIFAEQAFSLNRMLDRMEDLVRTQRHFASNLAHDLRTPLTRLRGLIAENIEADARSQVRLLEQAERECNSIIAIFDALLRLSEIEAGHPAFGPQLLQLRPIVEDVAETMEPVMADRGGALVLGRLADVAIVADASLITQLLVNLLENIALHTPPGTRATIALFADTVAGEAIIEIADNGPGIAKADLARLLRPFERGVASVHGSGSGLGLAIAQAIVRFHRGELQLADNAPGLVVALRFPLIPKLDEPDSSSLGISAQPPFAAA